MDDMWKTIGSYILTSLMTTLFIVITHFMYYTLLRSYPKDIFSIVGQDCQALKLNKEVSMDRCKWRKMIKDVRWSGWVWVGECFFWYRVVPDNRPLNGCVCVCVGQYYHLQVAVVQSFSVYCLLFGHGLCHFDTLYQCDVQTKQCTVPYR